MSAKKPAAKTRALANRSVPRGPAADEQCAATLPPPCDNGSVVLPLGTKRISVRDALERLFSASGHGYIDIFVRGSADAPEFARQIVSGQSIPPIDLLRAVFDSWVRGGNATPYHHYLPHLETYSSESDPDLYFISLDDFQRFAATYSVEVEFATPTGVTVAASLRSDPSCWLTTDEVCIAFDGIGLSSIKWRQRLTKDRPAWLMACMAARGRRGGDSPTQAKWCPLLIARALLEGRAKRSGSAVTAARLDSAFRGVQGLRRAAEAWKIARESHPEWGD